MPGLWRSSLVVVLGLVAGLVLAELSLRVHNPIEVRILESEIRLPVRKKVIYRNPGTPKLDREIVCARNILGFRGLDPPKDFEEPLTIVMVGGSTTVCRYLSEGKTWPDRLGARLAERFDNVWWNNAGMDGHSTFGHTILLRQVLLDLRPDYLVFLVGLNDTDRTDLNRRDATVIGTGTRLGRLIDASELLSTIRVLVRARRAHERGLQHEMGIDLARMEVREVSEEEIERTVEHNRRKEAVSAYGRRLTHLIELSRSGGIEPILVTQPMLYGDGIDPTTGVELGPIVEGRITSRQVWRVMEIYNDVTRAVGRDHDVLVIDLARELAKDSAYYHDWTHFTNEGAERVAEILSAEMVPFLESRGHAVGGAGIPGRARNGMESS
jgi:lysophospholipase L1-like esterase